MRKEIIGYSVLLSSLAFLFSWVMGMLTYNATSTESFLVSAISAIFMILFCFVIALVIGLLSMVALKRSLLMTTFHCYKWILIVIVASSIFSKICTISRQQDESEQTPPYRISS